MLQARLKQKMSAQHNLGGEGSRGRQEKHIFYPGVKVALTSFSLFTIYSAPLSFCVTPATRQFYTFTTMNLSHFDLKDLVNFLIMTKVMINNGN